MIVLGIDGGLNGGLALIESGERPRVVWAGPIFVMGEGAKKRVHVRGMIPILQRFKIDHAFIERAQAMPEQGSSAGFSYGRAIGAIEAMIEAMEIPLTVVEIVLWKKYHGLTRPPGLIGKPDKIKRIMKENSRQRAIMLFPESVYWPLKGDHDVAEAALIGSYGLSKLQVFQTGIALPASSNTFKLGPDSLDETPRLI